MRSLVALAGAVLLVTCTSTPPAACTADSACSGGRCIAGACFAKACGDTMCGLAKVCSAGACIDEQCVTKTCDPGSACVRGDCLATTCGAVACAAGQVCDPDANACVDAACYGVVCPSGQLCAAGVCGGGMSCGTTTCSANEACVSDTCVARCGTVNCGVGQACVGNTCVATCGSTTCAAGEVCVSNQCVVTCGSTTCAAGQACVSNQCVAHCGAVNCAVGQACVSNTCVAQCAGGTCDAGMSCDVDQCVEPSCVGIRCDGGVCQSGACHDACDLSCALPCPACTNGRTCSGLLECASRYCPGSVCTACTAPSQCPNGGTCMNGICRSGLLGPCASTLDCVPGNLVCNTGKCRLPLNASCSTDEECIQSLRCENLVCQRPRCILQLLEVQAPPASTAANSNQAMGLQPNGEIYVTAGQTGTDVRRYRVTPGGDAGIVEQAPTMAPLIAGPTNILAQGHSDTLGSGFVTSNVASPRAFHWMPGGGAFDGRVAVTIHFAGFNADAFPNLTNIGRFAKCGDNFYFAMQSSSTASGRVLLRFTTPSPVGSGTLVQLVTTSTARRDNNVFQYFSDVACTASTVYVSGMQNNQMWLQKLDPLTLADRGGPISLAPIDPEGGVGDLNLGIVDDSYLYVLGSRGEAYQFWDGGTTNLGNSNFGTIIGGTLNYTANAQGPVVQTYDAAIWRYGRRMMNGSVPPPDLDCQWQ